MSNLEFLDLPVVTKEDYSWDYEKEDENFNRELEKICHTLIGRDGKMFDFIKVQRTNSHMGGSCYFDFDNKYMAFDDHVGPHRDISSVYHELGHLMITPDHEAVLSAFGMTNPRIYYCGGGMFDYIPSDKLSGIYNECKVWAWEYLIRCVAGNATFGDPIPRHEEADFIDHPYSIKKDQLVEIVDSKIKFYLKQILEQYPDGSWEQAIHDRIAQIPKIINENYHNWDEEGEVIEEIEKPWGDEGKVVFSIQKDKYGYYQARIAYHDHDFYNYACKDIVKSKNYDRVKKFFDICCHLNMES